MRCLVFLALCTPAAAEHVTTTSAEALGAREARVSALIYGTRHVDLECARMTFLDGDVRGSFLGVGGRARHVWAGVHVVSTDRDAYRYFTPFAGVALGPATLVARSTGLYLGAVGAAPPRTLAKDFDVELRIALPVEVRARVRDVARADGWLRDVFLGLGTTLHPVDTARFSVPIFAGVGVRRELWNDRPLVDGVPMTPAGWSAFAWLEIGFAVERVQ